MADINPLSFIGKSNDPTLGQRTINASSIADQLQASLAKLNSQRAGSLQLADLNNLAAGNRNAVTQGFSNLSDLQGSGVERELSRRLAQALKGAEVGSTLQRSGFGIVDPQLPRSASEIGIEDFLGGFQLPGEKQEAAKAKATAKVGEDEEVLRLPSGEQVGLSKVKKSRSLEGQQQQTPLATNTSTAIINAARLHFGADAQIGEPFQAGGKTFIEVNGQVVPITGGI